MNVGHNNQIRSAQQPCENTSPTMSQILNLQENELDMLARFMGHNLRVHREYYRLPEQSLQVAKISKLLLMMEKGGFGLSAGETLDSLELKDDELAEGMIILLRGKILPLNHWFRHTHTHTHTHA